MSRIEELIREKCPDGVEDKPLYEVTTWDKNFKGVEKSKQPKVIKYSVMLAADLFALEQPEGDVFLLSTGEQTGWTTEELAGDNISEGEVVTIPWGKSRKVVDCIKYYKGKFVTGDNRIMTSNNLNQLDNKYLYYCILSKGDVIDTFYRGAGIQHPDMYSMLNLEIPVPPMEVQQEIVRILDKFTELEAELRAELDVRKKQYEYYRDELLSFDDTVDTYKMGEVLTFLNGRAYKQEELLNDGKYPVLRVGNFYTNDSWYYSDLELDDNKYCEKGDLLYSWAATLGPKIWDGNKCIYHYHIWKIVFDDTRIDKEYLYYYLQYDLSNIARSTTNSTMIHVSMGSMKERMISIPPIEKQKQIVSILNKFEVLCKDAKQGLSAEIEARRKLYEYYRDKLLSFERFGE